MARDLTIKFIKQASENILTLDETGFHGSKKLHSMGMWVCSKCGTILPLEKEACTECHEPKFITNE